MIIVLNPKEKLWWYKLPKQDYVAPNLKPSLQKSYGCHLDLDCTFLISLSNCPLDKHFSLLYEASCILQ